MVINLDKMIEDNLSKLPEYKQILELHIWEKYRAEIFVVGGILRDILSRIKGRHRDLDLVTYLDREQIVKSFTSLGNLEYNRYGNPRFITREGTFTIDVWNPLNFWGSQITVDKMLEFFYISINALAFNIRSKEIIDPVGAINDIKIKRARILPRTWEIQPEENRGVLVLRTLSCISRLGFTISNPETLIKFIPYVNNVPKDRLKKYLLSPSQLKYLISEPSLIEVVQMLKICIGDI